MSVVIRRLAKRVSAARLWAPLILLLLCLPAHWVVAEPGAVAVVYPELRDPYKAIFLSVISGIEERIKHPLVHYVLKPGDDHAISKQWLKDNDIKAVIALGKHAERATLDIRKDRPVILGAFLMSKALANNKTLSGISLDPDPEKLFSTLLNIAPDVRRITVVYNPDRDAWLIAQARAAASKLGLQIDAVAAADLRESARAFQGALSKSTRASSALWLIQNPAIIDNTAILPLILETSWSRQLIVFSSNPSHVKRGALFSLFPDNTAMGRSLAELTLKQLAQSKAGNATILPLGDLKLTLNLRTAAHLDIKLSQEQRREIAVPFPQE